MLKVKKLDPNAILPTVANPGEDIAYDLYALEDTILVQGHVTKVRTGIAAHQMGHGLLIRDRSSMAAKGIVTSGGVIDEGYRGEIVVMLTSTERNGISRSSDKIAQMIPMPVLTGEVVEVDDLGESSRGNKGFGSSGR